MTSLDTAGHTTLHSVAHEHGWITESTHPTSDGVVQYVRCASCDARRVDVRPRSSTPPFAISRPIG